MNNKEKSFSKSKSRQFKMTAILSDGIISTYDFSSPLITPSQNNVITRSIWKHGLNEVFFIPYTLSIILNFYHILSPLPFDIYNNLFSPQNDRVICQESKSIERKFHILRDIGKKFRCWVRRIIHHKIEFTLHT